jgi:hypothetical protein
MSAKKREPHQFRALLTERADSAENTRMQLDQALDRFANNSLIHLPPESKLTVRNLATEAGVNKDTPLSRYPKGHPKAGNHRFPLVVKRFKKLKKKVTPPVDTKDEDNQKLRERIKEQDLQILLSARANNQLDAENVEVKRRCDELEKDMARIRDENARLRQGNIKVVPIK